MWVQQLLNFQMEYASLRVEQLNENVKMQSRNIQLHNYAALINTHN